MVWYSHLLQNFLQFIVIHTIKGFSIVNKAEINIFLELSSFFDDPEDVGNLITVSSAVFDCQEIQPIDPKEISPGCSLEGLMLKLKLQYFGHLVQRGDSFEKTQMLRKTEGRHRRG